MVLKANNEVEKFFIEKDNRPRSDIKLADDDEKYLFF